MAQPNWIRICVGCGQARPKKELLRVVRCQDHLELDLEQRKPGRGAYVCSNRKCVGLARARSGFQRSFRMEVEQRFYDELIQQVKPDEY